ncbi:hypothetical protein RJ640_000280 [Escallonia rubra]|uniref:Knottins-like domain-containing protein n=1 Tax=Escallonia rubra TaxID=112253 RepID=A0AA88RXC6_9ASTE|nr:hypothetical protein RJ640_000280 [Escallonia rubra]
MGRSNFLFSLVFVLMVLMASDMGLVTEARTCLSQSHRFKGTCVSETNCASVCHTEGFHGGDCRGLRRRCFCKTNC